MGYNRRAFLKSAGAAAAGGMLGLAPPAEIDAAELAQVKLTLPWLPLGTYTYPFVAKKIGAWQQRGLGVSIDRGFGSERCACRSTRGNTISA